jgi:hypothetical protein
MQYMLLIYVQESLDAALPEDQLKAIYEGYRIFSRELAASGALRGGSELAPIATATTVRVRNGKVLTTDGPFTETKEQLGGYYLLPAARADLLRRAGRYVAAADAYRAALALVQNSSEQTYLQHRLDEVTAAARVAPSMTPCCE